MFKKYPSKIRKALEFYYQQTKNHIYDQALTQQNTPSAIKKRGFLLSPGSDEHEACCQKMLEQDQSIQTFLLLNTETNLCLAEMFLQKAHATARAKHAKLLYMLKSGSFANKQEKNQLNKKLVYYSSELDLYQEALRSLY